MPKGRDRAVDRARDPEAPPPTLGPLVVDWMQRYLVHGPGPVQGQPYRLHADLEAFIWMAYELQVGRAGHARRRYVETVLTAPKGVAKSELAAARCCVEALGPVVFDGFNAAGDPVGREPQRGDVTVYGNDEGQAGNTYLNVAFMLDCSDDGAASEAVREDYGHVDIGNSPESSSRTILPDGRGTIRPASARARTKEGLRDRFSVLEESGLMTLPGAHELHETIVRTARKVGGSVMHATNLYGPGEGSVLEMLDKDRGAGVKDLLWFQRTADAQVLPANVPLSSHPDRVLREQLRAAYGSCDYVDLDDIIAGIRRPTADDAKIRRFFFNMAASASGRWMRAGMWADRAKADRPLADGDIVALGFKGARRHGATALVACRLADGHLSLLDVWERPPLGDDWQVPADEVDAAIATARSRFRVVRAYCDPAQWQTDIERWSREFGDIDPPNGRPTRIVAEWNTGRAKAMGEAIDRFDTAVITGQLSHDDGDDLRRHVLHATRHETRFGVMLAQARGHEHIAAAVAAVLAFEAACDAIAVGLDQVDEPDPNEVFVH